MNLKRYTELCRLCIALDALFLSSAQPYATTIFQEFSMFESPQYTLFAPAPPSLDIQLFKKAPSWRAYSQEHLKTITYAKIGIVNASTILYCKQRKSYLLSMWLCFSQKNETRWLFSQINRVSRWAAAQVGRWACGCTGGCGVVGQLNRFTAGQGRGGWLHMWHFISYDLQQSSFVYLGGKTPLHPQVRFQRKWQENANLLTCKFSNKLF